MQRNWDEFGRRDPFWAVLTNPQRKNNRWDPAEFFATGEADIQAVIEALDSLGIRMARWRALDFGCAMGRLTQAMCRHFHYCVGVDIAPSMIRLAEQYNNFPLRCFYSLNAANNLSFLESNSFDFVFTRIVLQHIRPPYNRQFVAELARVLDRGGALVFQVPSRPAKPAASAAAGRGPLPWTAYKAEIQVELPPANVPAGQEMTLEVRVRNASPIPWPKEGGADGSYFVQLGNHWLKENEEMAVADDGRATLPNDLAGGEKAVLQLSLNSPVKPGRYWLELDMVEEGVTWFANRGSKTYRTRVVAVPSAKAGEGRIHPVMEMHGISKDEVVEIVRSAGAKIVEVREDHSAGGWESFLYIATKD
ncbi:MAG TPA: methyltransferase domain-containing protein [Candidatus Aquilonibacter sp.]|nr:methyltransferase domain-containing protein [Candidatus Aquilonibacter sp.]